MLMIQEEKLLLAATFNNKVKTYIFFVVLITLITSIIGIILVPFWIFGLGQMLSNKYFHTLKCELSTKNLKFSKGLIVHIEKTIPLENIQDLSFIGGPILRYFGLTLIRLETAGGGGGAHNYNMMSMLGINDAENFKQEILQQREVLIKSKTQQIQPAINSTNQDSILLEIRDELKAIKQVLESH